jgi:uncharacterized protein (DUF885 family)
VPPSTFEEEVTVLHLLLGLIALAPSPRPNASGAPDTVLAARVTALADRYVAAFLQYFPEMAEYAGLSSAPHDHFAHNSLSAVRTWQGIEDSLAAEIAPIRSAELVGTPAWITFGYLRAALETGRATRVCRIELWPVNSAFGWQTSLAQVAAMQPVGTAESRAVALARWQTLPRYLRTEVANLREGTRQGYTATAAVVRAVIEQLDGLLSMPPDSLPFMDPARRDSTPAFRTAWRAIVADSVRAAARAYRDFLRGEYLKRARQSASVGANRNGKACYRALLQQSTSLDRDLPSLWRDVTAQVTRDSAALTRVGEKVYPHPAGTPTDIRWLRRQLESDSANRLPTPDSVRAFITAAMARVRSALPRWFATVPAGDVALVPFPDYQQPTSASGQYIPAAEDGSRPATYLYRTHQPVKRVGTEATVFHETWPGHHLQFALIGEQRGRHPITRLFWVAGFGEGWGDYSETLAEEMGVYGSERDRLGAFMSLAPIMAMDLGVQSRGWSPAQAREFLQLQSPNLSPDPARSLVDLIPSIPGYVASYTIGGMEFRRLRREAEEALGPRFDIRTFHQMLLEDGTIPLPLLAEKVEAWIVSKGGKAVRR